jgi:2,3-bisphosphoglycerate-independent phosphoglycerate mutase
MTRTPYPRQLLLMALLLCLPALVEAKSLYRYVNADGVVVVDYQVPADAVGRGYEVLNNDGMVIEVVPRELTPEERKVKDAEEKRAQEARAEQERLRQWDESLMLRYSTVSDIEDARRRALGELQIRMSILRGNRRSLKQQVENYQAQAADLERSGMEVGVERLRNIETLQAEIVTTERDITERQRDIDALQKTYDADIARFKMLRDVVELRQRLSLQQSAPEAP